MEMKSPNIVPGEASETDDEDVDLGCKKIINIECYAGTPGEHDHTADDVKEADEDLHLTEELRLRRAMNERCFSLLNDFIHTTAVSVSKQLTETDSLLMKSQTTVQNTMTFIRKINDSTEQTRSKLIGVLSSNFVPNISF